jgi:dephospho-CoA kinase
MFADHGVTVIDADDIARHVVQPGRPALDDIEEAFGEDVIAADGTLDRQALGDRIFEDPEARKRLNAITHPRIAREMRRRTEEAGERGEPWVVYDAALLVENELEDAFDCLIVVTAEPETQIDRLQQRDGMTRQEAQSRLDAQLPLEEKVEVADYLIDNDGALEETRSQVDRLFNFIDTCIERVGSAHPQTLRQSGLSLDPPVKPHQLPDPSQP